MNALALSPAIRSRTGWLLLGLPFAVTFFLFTIDEGYNDLRWMSSGGNWFAFGLYWTSMILGELLVCLCLSHHWISSRRLTWTLLAGIPLGLGSLIGIFLVFSPG